MGLFTNPVTLSDGTNSHIFSYRAQQPNTAGSIAADYVELAADIDAESVLVVKHDKRSATPRHLLQRKVNLHPAAITEDTALSPMTLNLTLTGRKEFSAAEWQLQLNLLIDAITEPNFVTNMLNSML